MKKKSYPVIYSGQKQGFAKALIAGDFVFCSGTSGRLVDTGNVRENNAATQTVDALDKIRMALEEAGTSFDKIIKIIFYIKNIMKNGEAIMGKYEEYVQKFAPSLAVEVPAITVIGVDSLFGKSLLVEIEVTAIILMESNRESKR